MIWQVKETFPIFAPLYPRQDEVGQTLVDIGRGSDRGADYFLNNTLLGWLWGGGGTQRWGENVVESIYPNGANDDLLRATFDQNGLNEECTLSSGDPAAPRSSTTAERGNWLGSITALTGPTRKARMARVLLRLRSSIPVVSMPRTARNGY